MRAKLPLLTTANINAEQLPTADLMLVIAFGQKIAEHVVHHARLGSINLHASRLPKYRGAAPINWAIINGEATTGNSIIRLAQKMDAGAMLATIRNCRSEKPKRRGSCTTAWRRMASRLSSESSKTWPVEPQPKRSRKNPRATISSKLSRASAAIDFLQPAIELARRIRGLYPWPGCRVRMGDAAGTQIAAARLARARPGETEGDRWHPGEIMTNGLIQTGAGGLEILDIQPESRAVMSLADYRRGHPWPPGARIQSIE